MPVINGVYLKDFTALPGAVADADIIPIAITGNQIAYRTTVAGIVTDARITAKLLTGLSVTGGAVVAADTILQAFGKVQNQINGKQGTITLTTTGTSGAATLVSNTLNIPNYGSALTGYVPYTGATTDVDLGAFKLNAQSLHVKGTAGNGHLGLKHQSSSATAAASESSLFADSNGDMSFQNANLYLNKFVTSANSANRTYTFPDATGTVALVGGSGVGTVTSVAALTLGTTGTDLSSTVATGTTTPVITLQVPTASATNRGALSSADWTTFNNKAAALSGTINTIAYWDSSTTIASLALATYPSLTELSYVKGVTSAIQTQLNAKQATITLTTTGTSGAATFSANTLNIPQYQAAGTYVTSVTGTSPIVSSGGTTPAISIPVATTLVNGYLSSTDWTTFNGKQATITLTTTGTSGAATFSSNTLNIPNYADSFVGTVTSVAAITLGTTGSDLSSTVANGTTTPVITLQVPTASAANRGALSSADWSTFNGKQGTITLTTTGTSGVATFVANTLNIPNYADGGVLSLSAIGGTANANGATITGTVLNLQPADASFGGVVTTGVQTFAGAKTLTGALTGTSVTLSGNIIFDTTDRGIVSNTSDGSDNKFVSINGGGARGSDRGGTINLFGNESTGTGRIDVNAGDVVGGVINLVTAGLNRLTVNRDGSTTLAGALTGTSATFSSSVTASDLIITDTYANDPLIKLVTTTSGNVEVQLRTATTTYNAGIGVVTSGYDFNIFTNNTARLTIASTGAATFSSSNNTTALTISVGSNATFEFKGNSTSGYTSTFNINDTALYIGHNSASRNLVLQTASVDRLTISGSGAATFSSTIECVKRAYVTGISTNAAYTTYTSTGNSTAYFGVDNSAGTEFIAGGSAYAVNIIGVNAYPMIFGTNNTEKMRITSAGNVGIGTSSPSEKLEVNGAIKTAAPSGGTAKPFKVGAVSATGPAIINKVMVEIDSVVYYIPLSAAVV